MTCPRIAFLANALDRTVDKGRRRVAVVVHTAAAPAADVAAAVAAGAAIGQVLEIWHETGMCF